MDGQPRQVNAAGPAVPRVLLVTGAGGAGRTTVAAATALAAAGRGEDVLLLTTGEDGVLDRVLGTPVPAAEPAEVLPGLWAARTEPDGELRSLAALLRERGGPLWEFTGAEPLDDDELTPLPGAGDFALLRALRESAAGGWDAVVADLPPAPHALRTLALPGQLLRYLDRLLPPQKQAARALRPLLAELAGVPMPARGLYTAADRFRGELAAVREVLASPGTSVRLVAEPGPLAVEPLRTARAALALHGLRLDAVVANRMLPAASSDGWPAALSGEQRTALEELRGGDGPAELPVREVPHLGRSPRGAADLAALAGGGVLDMPDTVDGPDTADGFEDGRVASGPGKPVAGYVEDRLAAEGALHWRLPLPGARKAALTLVRRGDELVVGVGPHRRMLPLPSALRRCVVTGAAFEDGELCVRFAPDPALWPQQATRTRAERSPADPARAARSGTVGGEDDPRP